MINNYYNIYLYDYVYIYYTQIICKLVITDIKQVYVCVYTLNKKSEHYVVNQKTHNKHYLYLQLEIAWVLFNKTRHFV